MGCVGGERGKVEGGGWEIRGVGVGGGGGVKAEFANYFVLFILSLKMPFFDRGT